MSVTLIVGIILFGILALVVVALVLSWREVMQVAPSAAPQLSYALTETLRTEDGAYIELRRLPVPGQLAPHLPPVLCVHGIGIDHHNNDMFENRSVARHLSRRGRDVWLLTLRSGVRSSLRRSALTTFDRMARYDLPLAAALPELIPQGKVRRVVIMGSPGKVDVYDAPARLLAKMTPLWLIPEAPLQPMSRLVGRVAGRLRTPVHHRIINPENMAPSDYPTALATISTIPRALLSDFARFVRTGTLTFEGRPVLDALAGLEIPVQFVAGEEDRIAPPDHVRAAYEAWGRERPHVEKSFWVAGRASGAAFGYGHGDLAMGVRVDTEVLGRLGDFLALP